MFLDHKEFKSSTSAFLSILLNYALSILIFSAVVKIFSRLIGHDEWLASQLFLPVAFSLGIFSSITSFHFISLVWISTLNIVYPLTFFYLVNLSLLISLSWIFSYLNFNLTMTLLIMHSICFCFFTKCIDFCWDLSTKLERREYPKTFKDRVGKAEAMGDSLGDYSNRFFMALFFLRELFLTAHLEGNLLFYQLLGDFTKGLVVYGLFYLLRAQTKGALGSIMECTSIICLGYLFYGLFDSPLNLPIFCAIIVVVLSSQIMLGNFFYRNLSHPTHFCIEVMWDFCLASFLIFLFNFIFYEDFPPFLHSHFSLNYEFISIFLLLASMDPLGSAVDILEFYSEDEDRKKEYDLADIEGNYMKGSIRLFFLFLAYCHQPSFGGVFPPVEAYEISGSLVTLFWLLPVSIFFISTVVVFTLIPNSLLTFNDGIFQISNLAEEEQFIPTVVLTAITSLLFFFFLFIFCMTFGFSPAQGSLYPFFMIGFIANVFATGYDNSKKNLEVLDVHFPEQNRSISIQMDLVGDFFKDVFVPLITFVLILL